MFTAAGLASRQEREEDGARATLCACTFRD